jgi:hypothetical protein
MVSDSLSLSLSVAGSLAALVSLAAAQTGSPT